MTFIAENRYCFLASLTELQERKNSEDREILINEICSAIEKRIKGIILEKSAKSRAKAWSKAYSQSKTRLTFDSILFNIMTGKQQLPARPRDFRLSLPDEEKTIKGPELSDALSKLVDFNIIDPRRVTLPLGRGRPKRQLSEENRGRLSYYESSNLKKSISEIIQDPSLLASIDQKLIQSGKLYCLLKYSFEAAFYQAKENEREFLNTFRPYGVSEQQLESNTKKDGNWIRFKDMAPEKLKQLAGAYATKTLDERFKKNNIPIVYKIMTICDILGAS
jgi:hypothetical protein